MIERLTPKDVYDLLDEQMLIFELWGDERQVGFVRKMTTKVRIDPPILQLDLEDCMPVCHCLWDSEPSETTGSLTLESILDIGFFSSGSL